MKMRFIFKLMFWGFVALMIVPSFAPNAQTKGAEVTLISDNQSTNGASIDASDAIQLAAGIANDVRGICARDPQLCNIGEQVLLGALERARQGAIVVATMIEDHRAKKSSVEQITTGSVK